MAGFKTWADLDILTAADLNGYLMQQVVPRFASTAARDAAITAPEAGQLCYVAGLGYLTYSGTAWVFPGWQQLIARQTLGASAATVTFSAIPAFKALRLLLCAQGTTAAAVVSVAVRVNGDSTNGNYSYGTVQETTAATTTAAISTGTLAELCIITGATYTTKWAAGVIDLPAWTPPAGRAGADLSMLGTSYGFGANTTGNFGLALRGGSYGIAGPYTSLTLLPSVSGAASGSFAAGSEFSLYGIG